MYKKICITLSFLSIGLWQKCVCVTGVKSSRFVTETHQDIEEALTNFPERVPSGREIRTTAGRQISPGSVADDFAVNREIYNDINRVQSMMINLMKNVLNLSIGKKNLDQILLQINTLITLLSQLGIRYNAVSNFSLLIQQLQEIKTDLKNPPEAPLASPSTYYTLMKARLETILAEAENKLMTKLNE